QLAQCRFVAPFEGRVARVHVKEGQGVAAGAPVIDLVGGGVPKARLNVPSNWIGWLKPGAHLDATVDETGAHYTLAVARISGRVDAVSQTVEIEADFQGDTSQAAVPPTTSLRFYAVAAKVQAATRAAELGFTMCNDTRTLVAYRQAALLELSPGRSPRLVAHSGLAETDPNTPYALWLSAVVARIAKRCESLPANARVLPLSPGMLDEALAAGWNEWLPPFVWAVPLISPEGTVNAVLLLAREEPWPQSLSADSAEYALLQLGGLYSFAWWSLVARPSVWRRGWKAMVSGKKLRYVGAAILLAMLLPVREYTLVPAEVISTRSQVIASPREGVIHRMAVLPNTPVHAGDVLAELDDTTLRNRLAVAQAELATASVEMHQAAQQAIETQNAKADLGMAEGKWRERQVDVASL
ncbi:hypothetical protein KCV01_g24096, partial [Aureobasidium melanogenum]